MKFSSRNITCIWICLFVSCSLHGQVMCIDTVVINKIESKPKHLFEVVQGFQKVQNDTTSFKPICCCDRAVDEILRLINYNSRSKISQVALAVFSAQIFTTNSDPKKQILDIGVIEVQLLTEELARSIYNRYYEKKEKYLVGKKDLKIRLIQKGAEILILYSPHVSNETTSMFIKTYGK